MPKVAVLGANGQVGSEVCLLLANHTTIDLVPICRNPSGSAFLRYRGIACRHGRVSDPIDARRVLEDCDAVLNFALAQGSPSEARRINELLIEHAAASSAPEAKIVYFSTLMVHGDPRPGIFLRTRSAYGREKRYGEIISKAAGKRFKKPVFVLRLGHVCGELQNMTTRIREHIEAGIVCLPEKGDKPSNTVYCATIVEAVLRIIDGALAPGTYDLVSNPQWSWRRVYKYEAERIGRELIVVSPSMAQTADGRRSLIGRGKQFVRWAGSTLMLSDAVRDRARSVLARGPRAWSERAEAAYRVRCAGRDATRLSEHRRSLEATCWIRLDRSPLAPLSDPADLMQNPQYKLYRSRSNTEFFLARQRTEVGRLPDA
jgi:nucleoside-diphosphate-sugar epimerase